MIFLIKMVFVVYKFDKCIPNPILVFGPFFWNYPRLP